VGSGSVRPGSPGVILHAPRRYDLEVWLFTLGRERTLRRRIAALARLREGESVLDVGCGTGSLSIEAKRQVGANGVVKGVDASPEMIGRAIVKARRAGLAIQFFNATAQALPFPAARFDVALCALMLHHLSRKSRGQCVREMCRVVKAGGRVLVVEFAGPAQPSTGILARLHRHRHGHVATPEVTGLLQEAGLEIAETGPVGFGDLQFALVTVPQAT